MKGALKFLICIAAVMLLAIPSGVHAQSSSLTNNEMNQLAVEFAPYLYLHPDESFYPVSTDYAISRSTLKNIFTGEIVDNPSVSQLSSLTDTSAGYYLDNKMGTIDDDGIIEDFLDNAQNYAPTIYARVTEQNYYGETVYAIQYFFFYAYNNGPMNTHEGDWEMAMVVCDLSHEPIFAAYSQHLNGGYVEWELVEKTDNHPHVFVARGSHANYFRAYEGSIGPAKDVCSDSGRILAPEDFDIVLLGDVGNLPAEQGWLNFAGTWGDYGDETSGILGERGPLGPAYQAERWDSPITWADGLSKADKNWFSLNWGMANVFWMLMGLMGIVLLFTILMIYFRKKKQGTLGPRLLPFLYIDGSNTKSIATILAILAMSIGIAGYFMPWYSVTVDINAGDYSTPGAVQILQMDGLHGLTFNRLEPGSGLVQVAGMPIPSAWLMIFGVLIFVVGSIGIIRSRKFGFKLLGRGVGILVPAVTMLLMMSIIGSYVSGYVSDAPSEVMQIIDTVSANPVSGTTTQSIGDYGTTTLTWGIGYGAWCFFIAAILYFIAGIMLIGTNKEYFQTGKQRIGAQPPHAAPEYQYNNEYQPAPYQPEYMPPDNQPSYDPLPVQQIVLTCPRCGAGTSVMPGTPPFQCQGCGEWLNPPI